MAIEVPDGLPSPLYIAFQGLETYFVNKDDGSPLSAGYVKFFEDLDRSVEKDVYQQVRQPDNSYQFVNIGSIVTLTSVGTFASPSDGSDIQVYAFPYTGTETNPGDVSLYFLEVYSSDDILQFTREAQPPNFLDDGGDQQNFLSTDNQISNSQFIEVLFVPDSGEVTHSFSVSGTGTLTPIAPGWDLLTTGNLDIVVEQQALSTDPVIGNPPYTLNISSSGSGNIGLVQRFQGDPRFFLNSFVSASILVRNAGSASASVQIDYVPSDTSASPFILAEGVVLANGEYQVVSGTVSTVPDTGDASTDTAPDGYVDIIIRFETSTSLQFTNVQVVTVENNISIPAFIPDSVQRQQDYLFHYWQPYLNYKPIPSYLVGWDFPMNPAQPLGATVVASGGANTSKYVWDQTILFQVTASGVGITRASQGSIVLTANAAGGCALVQYLDQAKAREILCNPLSVNVSAYTNVPSGLVATVSLWYTTDASLPLINSNNSIVLSLDANGFPLTFNGSWTVVPRGANDSLSKADFTIGAAPSPSTGFNDYGFGNWNSVPDAGATTATFMAIVVGFASIPITNTVTIQSISLVPGNIPTQPAPQTADEVLRECQYYYEKSYEPAVLAGASSAIGGVSNPQEWGLSGGNVAYVANAFTTLYKVPKRAIATPSYYSTNSGTLDRVYGTVRSTTTNSSSDLNITNWTLTPGTKDCNAIPATVAALITLAAPDDRAQAWMLYQFVLDARLGVV